MLSNFADLGVPDQLVAALSAQGIVRPFAIQQAALPDVLAGHDVCGRAPTGSGKTLVFGVAAAVACARDAKAAAVKSAGRRAGPGRPVARPGVLILVPTRELAAQVQQAIEPLARVMGARVTAIYGGVGYGGQRAALSRGVDIVVGCPGRLEDLVAQGDVSFQHTHMVVIDEADRMADMGFLPAVKRLLDPPSSGPRQTLLFSATLDGEVDELIRRYQRDPRRHAVVPDPAASGEVHHAFWRVEADKRVAVTADVVAAHAPAIVFCRTRHGADRLTRRLGERGIRAAPIHGARSQPQRDRALAAFKAGLVQALVATDVAARGIHVDQVACVVHYDLPADAKDYLHRSGRTGRAGCDGIVVTMVGRAQAKALGQIQSALGYHRTLGDADPAGLPPSPAPEAIKLAAGGHSGCNGVPPRSGPRDRRDAQRPGRQRGSRR